MRRRALTLGLAAALAPRLQARAQGAVEPRAPQGMRIRITAEDGASATPLLDFECRGLACVAPAPLALGDPPREYALLVRLFRGDLHFALRPLAPLPENVRIAPSVEAPEVLRDRRGLQAGTLHPRLLRATAAEVAPPWDGLVPPVWRRGMPLGTLWVAVSPLPD